MDIEYEVIEHLISFNGVWVDGKGNGSVVYTEGYTIFNLCGKWQAHGCVYGTVFNRALRIMG